MLFVFVGASCSQEKKISNVAKGYLEALVDYRIDDAKKLGDESAVRFLDEQQKILNSWTPEERENARKNLANTAVKILEVTIDNMNARAKYELSKDGKTVQAETLYLVKTTEGWKVQEFM